MASGLRARRQGPQTGTAQEAYRHHRPQRQPSAVLTGQILAEWTVVPAYVGVSGPDAPRVRPPE